MKLTDGLILAFNAFTTTLIARPTANRVLTLPNVTGTLATLTDIPTIRQYSETVTGGTTITLARSPDVTRPISVVVNGQRLTREQNDFTVSGAVLTWNPTAAGFTLDSTDSVLAEYWA